MKDAIEYITHRDWWESRLGLERINELLARLGNPHQELKYVHVAGTNGKGSVCAMLASVLTAAGYKTGLYTSPYINLFNERIQVNGVPISDEVLREITTKVKTETESLADHPTEFELITIIAFEYFRHSGCDIVVLEVGLGGRLDATNAIPMPEVAVITPISYDHVAVLGDTIGKIAVEKAGIIKPGGCVVSAPLPPEAEEVIRHICVENRATLEFVDTRDVAVYQNSISGQWMNYKRYEGLEIPLLGAYQPQNTAVAVSVVEKLRSRGWKISDASLHKGLSKTRWPARFEIVHREPWVIVDGGHNVQCVDNLVDNLNTYFPGKKVTFITGVMADKDFKAMFERVIPIAKRVFTVTPDNPRAFGARELSEFFLAHGVKDVKPCKSVEQGVTEANNIAGKDGIVCAFGSFYMAGAIRKMFGLN